MSDRPILADAEEKAEVWNQFSHLWTGLCNQSKRRALKNAGIKLKLGELHVISLEDTKKLRDEILRV